MREIKFRAKERSGEWHVGSLFVEDGMGITYIVSGVNTHYETNYLQVEVASETVGQFTGLKDCKGQEIYEGDIVERDNSYFQKTCPALPKTTIGAIEWRDGEFIVKGSYKLFPSSDKFPIRVIGNIHDNPELLEAHA